MLSSRLAIRLASLVGLLGLALLASGATARAAEPAVEAKPAPVSRHVLLMGIDGLRPDALAKAKAPHLKGLIESGYYSDRCLVIGERHKASDTVSGPGWASILTGVWADKHGIQNNKFEVVRTDKHPHFFKLLKSVKPQARTISFDTWAPIKQHIVSGADVHESLPLPPPLPRGTALPAQLDRYDSIDALMEKRGVEVLGGEKPDVLFLYWHQIDEAGHNTAFHPDRAEYLQAVERVDARIGRVLKALEARPTRATEDWLILVTTDHGGRGNNHAGGQKDPERYTGLLIVSGAAAAQGKAESPTYIVDVVPTALTHLGVALDPAWQLDGKVTGLRMR